MERFLTKNIKIQKFISSLLIISIFAPTLFLAFPPEQVEAQTGIGVPTANSLLEAAAKQEFTWRTIYKEGLMLVAKKVLAKLTQRTINWINSGFHGNPLYVENPKSFFKDIAKTEVNNMVNMFGYDSTRYPYGKAFAQNIINSYQSQLATNAEYSLSRVINDPVLLNAYRTDFNVGGWSGFLVNTQYPQNNYIGFNMMATEELARRLDGTTQNAAQKVQTVLQQGQGFLSPQVCPSNPKYNNLKNEFQRPTFQPTISYETNIPKRENYDSDDAWGRAILSHESDFQARVALERTGWEEVNTCPKGLVSTTPGSVVASHIMKAVNVKFDQNTLAGALGNDLAGSFAAILDALMNKFLSDGLNALSNKNPKEEPSPEDEVEIPPPADALSRHPNQAGKVAEAKASLEAQGVSLAGECGAFAITNEAAKLIGEGAGVLSKPSGAGCQGYAFDIIVYPDGYIYDVLESGGLDNRPSWSPAPCIETGSTPICPGRYRPTLPGVIVPMAPETPTEPTTPVGQ